MPAWEWKPLFRGVGTGALTGVYMVPANRTTFLKSVTVANPTGGAVTLVVQVLQDPNLDGGAFRAAIPGQSIAAGATYLCQELASQMLNAGGQIQLQGTGLTFLGSGAEIPI